LHQRLEALNLSKSKKNDRNEVVLERFGSLARKNRLGRNPREFH